MAITVPFDLAYEFEVKALAPDVFAVLSDVPTSAGHFPKVAKLIDLGANTYRWEMKRVGTAQVGIQTIYPKSGSYPVPGSAFRGLNGSIVGAILSLT